MSAQPDLFALPFILYPHSCIRHQIVWCLCPRCDVKRMRKSNKRNWPARLFSRPRCMASLPPDGIECDELAIGPAVTYWFYHRECFGRRLPI